MLQTSGTGVGKIRWVLGEQTADKQHNERKGKQAEQVFSMQPGRGLQQEFSADQAGERAAYGFDHTYSEKQQQKNGSDLMKFPPGNLFI